MIDNLKFLRKHRKISRDDFDVETVEKLCRIFDITTQEFFEWQ